MNKGYFLVDYQLLLTHKELIFQWDSLKNDLVNNSEYCLKCIGLAMHQFIFKFYETKENENIEDFELKVIYPRLINYSPVLDLKELRVNYYGKTYNFCFSSFWLDVKNIDKIIHTF